MKNSFWFGCRLQNFLFLDFNIDSYAGLLAVCCGTAILVLAFEIIKTSRVIKKMKSSVPSGSSLFRLAFRKSTERSNLIERQENGRCRQKREVWFVSDIVGHCLEVVIGYLLMMIAMTFNGYVMISICLGALVGYMLFGTAVFNISAQMVVQRIMCIGCEIQPDGDLAPIIIEEENEPASTSEMPSNSECHDQQVLTTAQIHDQS